jgi:hypothetical protein
VHALDHVLGDLGHPADGGPDLLGYGDVGHPEPGDLGHVHRQVAHPLELGHHPQRGHHDAEVAGDRRLEREQGERRVLDPLAGPVDLDVGADHPLGGLGVAAEQGGRGSGDGRLDLRADPGEVVEDRLELVVEDFTHAQTVGSQGDQPGC